MTRWHPQPAGPLARRCGASRRASNPKPVLLSSNHICRLKKEKSSKILFASHTYLNPNVGCCDSRPSIHDDPHCGWVISNQLFEDLNPSILSTLEKKILNFRSWTKFHLLYPISIPLWCVDLKLWQTQPLVNQESLAIYHREGLEVNDQLSQDPLVGRLSSGVRFMPVDERFSYVR